MSRSKGRRYDNTPRLNKKKVFATMITIVVFAMIVISLNNLLMNTDNTKDVSILTTYISIYDNNKWGVIDNKGNVIINCDKNEMILIPDKNKAIFILTENINSENETYTTKVVNENGESILTEYSLVQPIENTDGSNTWYENNVLKFEKYGKYGLISLDGKEILEANYDNIYALKGIEKSLIIEKNGLKGIVNTSLGEVIIEPEYQEITSLSKSYEDGYIVKNVEGKCGIISADKTKLLNPVYDEIKNVVGNGYFVVVENGVQKVIDKKGAVILSSGFDSIEEILVDNFIITKNGKYGVISKTGETVIESKYEDLKQSFSNYYIAKQNGKYGIIDNTESKVIDFIYTSIIYIKEADFFKAERENYRTDIIDRNLKVVLNNIIVSDLNIDNGYLRIRDGEEYKYYNLKLEEKTNKDVLTTNTLFLVKENGKYGYENKNGDRIVDCIYDDAKEQNEYGYCAVNKDGKWGSLASNGAVVLEPSLDLSDYLYIDFIETWHKHKNLGLNVYIK